MKSVETIDIETWENPISKSVQNKAVKALEGGKVLFFPALSYALHEDELHFLTPEIVNPKSKNISYDIRCDRFAGSLCTGSDAERLKAMVKRYAVTSRQFIDKLIPHYTESLIQAKTSFRPVEIFGRKSSYRKDDTLLHVDSFPSSPTKGKRILRLFTNVHPGDKPRVWHIGEPFEDVVSKMAPRASRPIFGVAFFLNLLNITKDYRTAYDHYMLQMHDAMKGDAHYQKTVPQEEMLFPPGSSWMVYTDQVSHAAMSGQHVFEQTFHLPVSGLNDPTTAPLKVLEKFFNKALV
jgi:3-deoxy-D-manno-octulosonic acid hydroxylase-like protein